MSDEWVVIQLDEKVARMHGLPARVPAPKSEFEGLADAGFELPKLKKWITAFLTAAPAAWRAQNVDLAKSYDRFIAKADFWQRGVTALGKKDVAGAISAFKMITSVDPDDHAARMNLGLAYAQSGDMAQAQKNLAQVRATYEGDADYHVALGQTFIATGDRDGAADEFALALEAQPENSVALKALASLGVLVAIYENPRDAGSLTYLRADSVQSALESMWEEAPRDFDYFLGQLEYHRAEARHEVALAAADRALAIAGDDKRRARVRLWRAGSLRALGRLDDALGELERALAESASDSPEARASRRAALVERARVHTVAGRADAATADIDAALADDAGELEALALRFPLERTLSDDTAKRLQSARAWAEAHPEAAGAWMWLGLLSGKAGAEADSLEALAKAVSIDPSDEEIRATYWVELGRAGKWDEVVSDAARLDMPKAGWKLRWNEAEAYAALGRSVEARAAFTALNADESIPLEIRARAKRGAAR